MSGEDEDLSWPRQLLVTLGVMLVVALIVGAIAGLVALAGSKVAGVTPDAGPSAPESLFFPTGIPTTTLEVSPGPLVSSPSPSPGSSAPASPSSSPSDTEPITLQATPAQVKPGHRITLSGTYPEGQGATLQVQRLQAGTWTDFPVTVRVRDGAYSTYIVTGRTGVTKLRMFDPAGRVKSNVATVTIG